MKKAITSILLVIITLSVLGQEQITVNGTLKSGRNKISKGNIKNIISYFNGDLLIYGTRFGTNFILTIDESQAEKHGIEKEIVFVIINDATPYYILANYNQPEIPKNGTWTLTKFPNSNIWYVDKLNNTPFSKVNKASYESYYSGMQTIVQRLKNGDEAYAMKYFRNQDQTQIKYSNHRFYFLNLMPYCINLLESDYETVPQQTYKTLPDKLSDLALKYVKYLSTDFNDDIIGKLRKTEWETWWKEIVNTDAFPSIIYSNFKLNKYKAPKYASNELKYVDQKIYYNSSAVITCTDIKTNEVSELTNNHFFNTDFYISDGKILTLGDPIKLHGKIRFAKYSSNKSKTEIINPFEILGTDSIRKDAPLKITNFNNSDIVIYLRKGRLNIKSIESKGVTNDKLKDFKPQFYDCISSMDENGKLIKSKEKINPKRIIYSKLTDLCIAEEKDHLTVFYALESTYFTKQAEDRKINTLHLLSLDHNYNIIKDIQVNAPQENKHHLLHTNLNATVSQSNYLLTWITEKSTGYKSLHSIVLNSEFNISGEEKFISESEKSFGALSENDNFYLIFRDDLLSDSNIRIEKIDHTGNIIKTYRIKMDQPIWHIAKTLKENKLHIYNKNRFELEERVITLD